MSEIKPALTAEEWRTETLQMRDEENPPGYGFVQGGDENFHIRTEERGVFVSRRHALAALCLYGQPFGFTHEDVAMLRDLASPPDVPSFMPLILLADRIAALLPEKP